jgi:hypothetical protein
VRIPFGGCDLTVLPDFFAVVSAFLITFVVAFFADLEAAFFAPVTDVFFLVVFFFAILVLSLMASLTLPASPVRFFSYPFEGLAVFLDVLEFTSIRTRFVFIAFDPLAGARILGLSAIFYGAFA